MSPGDDDDEYVPTFLKTEMPFVSKKSDPIDLGTASSTDVSGPYPILIKPPRTEPAQPPQWTAPQPADGLLSNSAIKGKLRTPPKLSHSDETTPGSTTSMDSNQYYSANGSFEQPVHISEPVGESWPFPAKDRSSLTARIQRSPRAFSDPVHRGILPVETRNSSLDTIQANSSFNTSIYSNRRASDYSGMNGPRSVSWNALNPSEWSSDRVLAWLDANKFGNDWISIFREQNIHGSEFLALANYQNLKKLGIQSRLENDTRPSRFIHLLRKLLDRSQLMISTDPLQSSGINSQISGGNSQGTGYPQSAGYPHSTPYPQNSGFSQNAPFPQIGSYPQSAPYPSTISSFQSTSLPQGIGYPQSLGSQSSGYSKAASTGFSQTNTGFSQSTGAGLSQANTGFSQTNGAFSQTSTGFPQTSGLQDAVFQAINSPQPSNDGFLSPKPASGPFNPEDLSSDHLRPNTITKNTHKSSENLSTLQYASSTFVPRTRTVRPMSTFEPSHLVKPLWQSPSSPSLKNGALLRRHRRSSSSESSQSVFGAPLEQTVSLDSGDPSAKANGVDLQARRGLFNRLKSRHGPTKSKDNLKLMTKPNSPSPVQSLSFLPDHLLPKPSKAQNKHALVTIDNETFKLIDYSSIQTIHDFKILLSKELALDLSKLTLCLTDFAHEYGGPLDDKSLTEILYLQSKDCSFMKFYVSDGIGRRSSVASEKSANRPSYPNTPAHLIGDKRTSTDLSSRDYFNIKNSDHTKLESVSSEKELDFPYNEQINSASSSTFRVIRRQFSGNNDSFRVLRPSKSPVEASSQEGTKQSSNLVALREAPPPPLPLRQSSVKLVPTKSLKKASAPPKLNIQPNRLRKDSDDLVQAYSPGQSQQLIPQPYKSRNQKVARKPVSATATHAISIPSTAVEPPASSPSAQFQENDISWEDAPEFVDNTDSGDDSDSGLWAKKPPSSTEGSANNTLRSSDAVETIRGSSYVERPNLKVDTNSLTPVSPSRISSTNSPSPSEEAWAVRPPAEVVYDNLERFFPDADLDKPIIDEANSNFPIISNTDVPHKILSPVVEPKGFGYDLSKGSTPVTPKARNPQSSFPKRGTAHRMKSIRVVAREASEARRRMASQMNESTDSTKGLVRRKSTKLWGQKVVEMTRKDIESGHVSKLRDQKGGYQQYLWVKGELIGKGTFGKVYLGLNATAGEMMAVKQVEIPDGLNDQDSQRQKEVIEALHSEVETLKDLDHLNIVQYLGFETFGGVNSLFLEYVPGGSIGKILRMHGRFEEPLIKSLTRQVLEGLAYLHSKGILHRDLKADNLLLDLDGICKISDFGISKKSRNIYTNDAEFSMQGTIFWMAPEVIHNVVSNEKQGYSAKVDVWSLGCVVLEMFAGRRPWSTDEAIGAMFKLGTTKQAPPIPEDTQPYVSESGRKFLDLCFIINPEDRPTAQTLLEDDFSSVDKEFDFSKTAVAKKIRFDNQRRYRSQGVRPV